MKLTIIHEQELSFDYVYYLIVSVSAFIFIKKPDIVRLFLVSSFNKRILVCL